MTAPPDVTKTASPSPAVTRLIWAGLAAFMLVVAGLAAVSWQRGAASAPPVFGELPDFALTERSGQMVTPADLAGKPWVADFIFTRCRGTCPVLSTRMRELRRLTRDAGVPARFVSFSVDPSHDTPAVLREYAAAFGADGDDWLFVTGERDKLYDLIGRGFRLSVADRTTEDPGATAGELITHSDRFVLVDGRGRIRGYYHGTDPQSAPVLLRDLGAVARED
ncbi:MAG: SCO family protein [Candidatus Binatia bacterium]